MKNNERRNVFRKPIFVLIGFLFVALVVIQLGLTYRFASAGADLDRLEMRSAQLQEEIRLLEQENSQLGSLKALRSRAEALGFAKTSQIVYLPARLPVALGY